MAAAAEHHSLRLARLSKVTAASRDGVVQVGDRDYGRLPGSRPGVGVTGTVQGRTTHQLEGHRDSVVNHSEARSTIVAIKVPARQGTANPSPTRSLHFATVPVTVTGTLPELDLKFESESVPVPGLGCA